MSVRLSLPLLYDDCEEGLFSFYFLLNFRCRYRRQRRKASLSSSRFLSYSVQFSNQTSSLAPSQFVPSLRQALCTIRHPSWSDHLDHASRFFFHFLFCGLDETPTKPTLNCSHLRQLSKTANEEQPYKS
jgi:hypothetical protein